MYFTNYNAFVPMLRQYKQLERKRHANLGHKRLYQGVLNEIAVWRQCMEQFVQHVIAMRRPDFPVSVFACNRLEKLLAQALAVPDDELDTFPWVKVAENLLDLPAISE